MPETNPTNPNFPPTAGEAAGMRQAINLDQVDNTSDANKPVSTAQQAALDAKADLVGGLVPSSQLPAIAISEYLGIAANEAAMLALSGQKGDWCTRTDLGTTFIITGDDPSLIGDWTQIATPSAPVTSVQSQTGAIVLGKSDIGLGNVPNVNATNVDNHIDGTVNKVFTAANETELAQALVDILTIFATAVFLSDIDTLAELNTILTDATLIDTNDARLSNARTPTAHTHTASEVTDFDTEVTNNATVAANTAKVSAGGSVTSHSDVTSAGSGAIITSSERTTLQHLTPRTQPNNTSTVALYSSGGTSRVDQANSATNYTVTIDSNAPVNAFDLILINATTEPTVNGVSTGKIAGATFAASTDMHMVIRTLDGTNIQYFFLEI